MFIHCEGLAVDHADVPREGEVDLDLVHGVVVHAIDADPVQPRDAELKIEVDLETDEDLVRVDDAGQLKIEADLMREVSRDLKTEVVQLIGADRRLVLVADLKTEVGQMMGDNLHQARTVGLKIEVVRPRSGVHIQALGAGLKIEVAQAIEEDLRLVHCKS